MRAAGRKEEGESRGGSSQQQLQRPGGEDNEVRRGQSGDKGPGRRSGLSPVC